MLEKLRERDTKIEARADDHINGVKSSEALEPLLCQGSSASLRLVMSRKKTLDDPFSAPFDDIDADLDRYFSPVSMEDTDITRDDACAFERIFENLGASVSVFFGMDRLLVHADDFIMRQPEGGRSPFCWRRGLSRFPHR